MNEAIKKLELKNYHITNQFDGSYSTLDNIYELWKDDKIMMDNLSEIQVIQLAELL